MALDQVAAVHLQLGPGFLVHVGGLRDDVGHHKSGLAHMWSGIAVAVGAHVATIKATSRVILGCDVPESSGEGFIGMEGKARGVAQKVGGQLPAHPVWGAFGVVVGKGKILLFHQEVVLVPGILSGSTGIPHFEMDVIGGLDWTDCGDNYNGRYQDE